MAHEKPICRKFAQDGTCRFGQQCRFAHVGHSEGSSTSARTTTTSVNGINTMPPNLRIWQRNIKNYNPSSGSTTHALLLEAHGLLTSGSTGAQHEVIKTLASEKGTTLIRAVSELDPAPLGLLLLPFLQILTHPDTVNSLVLEQHVGTLYNVLYGLNGLKGAMFFRNVTAVIAKSHTDTSKSGSLLTVGALESFARMIAINQSAAVSDNVKEVALELKTCVQAILDGSIPNDILTMTAAKLWKEIQTRLQIGAQIPDSINATAGITSQLAQFNIDSDLPGDLCRTGARHDNDSVDINLIQVLPTALEIGSSLSEYLPHRNPRLHHIPGARGLLDRQFRLLREDTVGQLRDAVRRLIDSKADGNTQKRTQALRTNAFENAIITGSFWNSKLGLLHLVEFDQPKNKRLATPGQRRQAWMDSKDLPVDSCVCLVGANRDVIFCTVVERDPGSFDAGDKRAPALDPSITGNRERTLFKSRARSAIVLRLAKFTPDAASHVLSQPLRSVFSLVEFPGVLLASFNHTLEALQNMSESGNLPFADIIAPTNLDGPANLPNEPPDYAIRADFGFDLSEVVKGASMQYFPGRPFDRVAFCKASGLDDSQAQAFIHGLSNKFALIQGPPGTGKSFVGVQIIRTLLQNEKSAKLGPILCVCYTNHALDQILEHLASHNVQQIIRIGGRSKSEALARVNLAAISHEMERTKNEKHLLWQANQRLDWILEETTTVLARLSKSDFTAIVRNHIAREHPAWHARIFGAELNDEGWETVRNDPEKTLKYWLGGGSRDQDAPSRTEFDALDFDSMSHVERKKVFDHWAREAREQLMEEFAALCDEFMRTKNDMQICHDELSLRCLRQAKVIGVTTTGLAKNINLLKKVKSKVLIVEEAAEVTEAHFLPALISSLEHVIAIGDHLQLRPQIANYDLSAENPRGEQYSLDISLFERLIYPQPGLPSIPFATLQTQRRMHPNISRLIRNTVYEDLADDSSVSGYPEITGIRHRLFWLDHDKPENAEEMSKSNDFEVEVAAALVSHIVKQGAYNTANVTVLTPYLAQLRQLRRRFSNVFEIEIGDRDQRDLVTAGIDEPEEGISAKRATLAKKLRISTVDNFQGEEADVIVVSLVRSNEAGRVGFIKTPNRINVLLSRARHAMYVIGNSTVARRVQMWAKVIEMLEVDGAIGPKLPLICPRHPDTPIEVATADDFSRLAPEGGCSLPCHKRLKCGHTCVTKCHAQFLHDVVVCQSPCPRLPKTCNHPCRKVCGLTCDELCQEKMKDIPLPCGHIAAALKCHESQTVEKVKCLTKVRKPVPRCGHAVDVHCSTHVEADDYRCKASCGEPLPCGHECGRKCHECNTVDQQGAAHKRHPECNKICGRLHTTCSHSCQKKCHGREKCPPCDQPCTMACCHSKCTKTCCEPCAPCAEKCAWACEHQGACRLPCAVPCSRLPCGQPCGKTLSCGHLCPSICGEACPQQKFCQKCGEERVLEMVVDYIMFSKYRDIDLTADPVIIPECGHIQTVSSMDGHMALQSFYEQNEKGEITGLARQNGAFDMNDIKVCPSCRGSLRSIHRYNRIVKRGLIDESTKRFIVWANSEFVKIEEDGYKMEKHLEETLADAQFSPPQMRHGQADFGPIVLRGSSHNIIRTIRSVPEVGSRYKDLWTHRQRLQKFNRNVAVEEQPFRRVWDLCRRFCDEEAHRKDMASFEAASGEALNFSQSLLTRSLLLHTDASMLNEFVEIWMRSRMKTPALRPLSINTAQARKDCLTLFKDAEKRDQPRQQVEALINFAFFAAAEMRCPEDSKEVDSIRAAAEQQLTTAERIVKQKPSTAVLSSKIEAGRKAITGTFQTIVTDDEMRAVYKAMATQFSGTGHWYRCENGHPFTIGECGMPMQTARCPQCGAQIGGRSHQAVEGVQRADDIERQFGRGGDL